jgi:hypothetical protein
MKVDNHGRNSTTATACALTHPRRMAERRSDPAKSKAAVFRPATSQSAARSVSRARPRASPKSSQSRGVFVRRTRVPKSAVGDDCDQSTCCDPATGRCQTSENRCVNENSGMCEAEDFCSKTVGSCYICDDGECVSCSEAGRCCNQAGVCSFRGGEPCAQRCTQCEGGSCQACEDLGMCCADSGRCVDAGESCGTRSICAGGTCVSCQAASKCCVNGVCQDSCLKKQCCEDGVCKSACKVCQNGACRDCGSLTPPQCCSNGAWRREMPHPWLLRSGRRRVQRAAMAWGSAPRFLRGALWMGRDGVPVRREPCC